MTDLERRALLGDKQAQEECTRQGIVLPCPFCGGKAEEAYLKRKKLFASMRFPYNTHYVYIRCKTCGATGKLCWTVENAIESWNRRAGEDENNGV